MTARNQYTGRSKVRLNALAFTLILEELMSGPCTAEALCEHSGLTKTTIYLLLRTMHEHKVLHIAGWEKDSFGRVGKRVYGFGAGKDAKKPVKSNAQACKDFRARQKLNAAGAMFGGAA